MTSSPRLVVALLFLCATPALAHQGDRYLVECVIDGDTVAIASIGTVRLIGVDTPETVDPRVPVQHFGLESAAYVRQMLVGKSVRVEYDRQRTDKYRRTLAYLYLDDGRFVNLEIIRQGYGHAYVEFPFAHMERFKAAEREAREARRGLWADDQTAATTRSVTERAQVWVNGSSKVYHCPGTRYYGNTPRGSYMTESEARKQGNRPAYGRNCGPLSDEAASASKAVPSETAKLALGQQQPVSSTTTATSTAREVKVWVNTSSKVYHCPGTRYYGTTKRGSFMSQAEAEAAGHRPAGGRACS